jgi:hypothetical protein
MACAGGAALGQAPTMYDQYMLELTNWVRANPDAAAAEFGINLNEGLPAGTITDTPKQPLAWNTSLMSSATSWSNELLATNTFTHGATSNAPMERMQAAGYAFNSPWTWGENLAWVGNPPSLGAPDPATTTAQMFQGLFVDSTEADRGHRINLMTDSFKEVGVAIVAGNYTQNGTTYLSLMATQDFASQAGNSFITGVAYNNSNNTNFYNPNLGGYGSVNVTATNASTGQVFTTSTTSSGGYGLQVPSGTYSVLFSGTGIPYEAYKSVTVGSLNVEVDASNTQAAHPWQNPVNPLDVNGDGHVTPQDALLVIQELNTAGAHVLAAPTAGTIVSDYYDVTGANSVVPLDALKIIQALNDGDTTPTPPTQILFPSGFTPSASATVMGSSGASLVAVPEPSSAVLAALAAGGGAMWFACRRTRRRRC